jgi:hypothetical protein
VGSSLQAVRNAAMTLKPGGHVLLRDYAVGDWAELRFSEGRHLQKLADNYYVRGDGTRAYYFSKVRLTQSRQLFPR